MISIYIMPYTDVIMHSHYFIEHPTLKWVLAEYLWMKTSPDICPTSYSLWPCVMAVTKFYRHPRKSSNMSIHCIFQRSIMAVHRRSKRSDTIVPCALSNISTKYFHWWGSAVLQFPSKFVWSQASRINKNGICFIIFCAVWKFYYIT